MTKAEIINRGNMWEGDGGTGWFAQITSLPRTTSSTLWCESAADARGRALDAQREANEWEAVAQAIDGSDLEE